MLKTLLITPCSDRKSGITPDSMNATSLVAAPIDDVAAQWLRKVSENPGATKAINMYAGRSFSELRKVVQAWTVDLMIISAGLGLVRGDAIVPNYGITVSRSSVESVFNKISNAGVRERDWWRALKLHGGEQFDFNKSVDFKKYDLVLLILTKNYSKMISDELRQISGSGIKKLRIVGVGIDKYLPERLKPCVLPYDQRLNGPDSDFPGTMTDLPARCAVDFMNCIQSNSKLGVNLEDDIKFVSDRLSKLRMPKVPTRQKLSDEEIKKFIQDNWVGMGTTNQGSLKNLRESGRACEQSRFAKIFKEVKRLKLEQGELSL